MIRTRVGYAGGTTADPTYRDLGDHTETVEVDFDPDETSFERLLDVFFAEHDPFHEAFSRQYMAAVFFHDEAQRAAAAGRLERLERERGGKAATRVLPFTGFHLAEAYHQKYSLRAAKALEREMQAFYPTLAEFVASTAVTRINAFAAGHGKEGLFERDLPRLGLSAEGRALLIRLANR